MFLIEQGLIYPPIEFCQSYMARNASFSVNQRIYWYTGSRATWKRSATSSLPSTTTVVYMHVGSHHSFQCDQYSTRSVVVRRQPLVAVDEVDGEVLGRLVHGEPLRPWHALGQIGAGTRAVELREHHLPAHTYVRVTHKNQYPS